MINKIFNNPYLFVIIMGVLFYFTPLKSVNWGQFTSTYPSTVTVQGVASSEQSNQVASFGATVSAKNMDKEQAVADLNEKLRKMTSSIRSFGIEEKDIQTQSLNIYQMDVYNPSTGTSEKKEWYASNSVNVKIKDISRVADFTMLLTSTGADNIWGPNFTIDNSMTAGDSLINLAIENARQKAEEIAKKTGKKLGKVIVVQESSSGGYYPMPYARDYGMSMVGGGGGDYYGGTSTITKTVNVTYELN